MTVNSPGSASPWFAAAGMRWPAGRRRCCARPAAANSLRPNRLRTSRPRPRGGEAEDPRGGHRSRPKKREENIMEGPRSRVTDPRPPTSSPSCRRGAADVKAVSARVPSLAARSRPSGAPSLRFYIRGLGNTDFDLNASQPVSMIVDEVVLENPDRQGVCRSRRAAHGGPAAPAGHPLRANTPAGIVKFDTVKPSKDTRRFARVSYRDRTPTSTQGGGRGSSLGHRCRRARLHALPVAVRPGSTTPSRARTTRSVASGPSPAASSSSGSPRRSSTPSPTSTAGTSTAPRACFRANIIETGHRRVAVAGYRQDQVSQDGLNQAEDPGVRRGAQAGLRLRQGHRSPR